MWRCAAPAAVKVPAVAVESLKHYLRDASLERRVLCHGIAEPPHSSEGLLWLLSGGGGLQGDQGGGLPSCEVVRAWMGAQGVCRGSSSLCCLLLWAILMSFLLSQL